MKNTPPVSASRSVSRRVFLAQLSTAAAAFTFSPRIGFAAGQPALTTTPAKKLGVALVGLGGYSTGQLAPALGETDFCRLTGVVTGDPAKGARWARKHEFPEKNIYTYDTMNRMADNPDIDIVYIVTPNGLHAQHAIAAARAGKHIICEKPMASTVAECDAILAACAAAKVRHSMGYRLFFDPYHNELIRLARENDFGPFMNMSGSRAFRLGSSRWRADKKLAGGGPLMDLGVYLIQAACMAKNGAAPVSVTAIEKLPKTRPDIFRDTEETITWKMNFSDGAVADFSTSYAQQSDTFRAQGQNGGWIHFKSGAFAYQVADVETSAKGTLDYGRSVNHQQARQMDDFAQCILTGRASPVPGEMGRRDLTIIEAIYASAAAGGKLTKV